MLVHVEHDVGINEQREPRPNILRAAAKAMENVSRVENAYATCYGRHLAARPLSWAVSSVVPSHLVYQESPKVSEGTVVACRLDLLLLCDNALRICRVPKFCDIS